MEDLIWKDAFAAIRSIENFLDRKLTTELVVRITSCLIRGDNFKLVLLSTRMPVTIPFREEEGPKRRLMIFFVKKRMMCEEHIDQYLRSPFVVCSNQREYRLERELNELFTSELLS